jgi:hypothetical protein
VLIAFVVLICLGDSIFFLGVVDLTLYKPKKFKLLLTFFVNICCKPG